MNGEKISDGQVKANSLHKKQEKSTTGKANRKLGTMYNLATGTLIILETEKNGEIGNLWGIRRPLKPSDKRPAETGK